MHSKYYTLNWHIRNFPKISSCVMRPCNATTNAHTTILQLTRYPLFKRKRNVRSLLSPAILRATTLCLSHLSLLYSCQLPMGNRWVATRKVVYNHLLLPPLYPRIISRSWASRSAFVFSCAFLLLSLHSLHHPFVPIFSAVHACGQLIPSFLSHQIGLTSP